MQKYIDMLSKYLKYINHTMQNDSIIFDVESTIDSPVCPYCGNPSNKRHSLYKKVFMDIPLNNKVVKIRIKNRKMFCCNSNCSHKTFAETYNFVEYKSRKTKRLTDYIVNTAVNINSVTAQNLLRNNGIDISKSTICSFLKDIEK